MEVYECACLIELPELKVTLSISVMKGYNLLHLIICDILTLVLNQGRDRLGDKPLFVLVTSTIEAHDF